MAKEKDWKLNKVVNNKLELEKIIKMENNVLIELQDMFYEDPHGNIRYINSSYKTFKVEDLIDIIDRVVYAEVGELKEEYDYIVWELIMKDLGLEVVIENE